MDTGDAATNREAIGLAFTSLCKALDQLVERSVSDAHPDVELDEDALWAITEPTPGLFEDLAGLAYVGLATLESDREWFLTKGLGAKASYDFWYTLALTVTRAADAHMESEHPARVEDAIIISLFHSLLRFLPYACVAPGDCTMRTADALIYLCIAFPLESMRRQLHDAKFSASCTASMLSAVDEKVRESHGASHAQDGHGDGGL